MKPSELSTKWDGTGPVPKHVITAVRRLRPEGLAGHRRVWQQDAVLRIMERQEVPDDSPGWRVPCAACATDLQIEQVNFKFIGNFEIDHIEALCLDGDHHIDNLQLLCPECHAEKSERDRALARRRSI